MKTVAVADLERTLREMEFSLDCCNPTCPHCGKENLITGFSEMLALTCRHCGKLVRLSDDPNIDRIFGPEE